MRADRVRPATCKLTAPLTPSDYCPLVAALHLKQSWAHFYLWRVWCGCSPVRVCHRVGLLIAVLWVSSSSSPSAEGRRGEARHTAAWAGRVTAPAAPGRWAARAVPPPWNSALYLADGAGTTSTTLFPARSRTASCVCLRRPRDLKS